MHNFLLNNREELLTRCKIKIKFRRNHTQSDSESNEGVPVFLSQLTRTLAAEHQANSKLSVEISGLSGEAFPSQSEIRTHAITHGEELLNVGCSVDQVVHDYGDLCQAITDLAVEQDVAITANAYRTLNRCLDNAMAGAVLAFTTHHDAKVKIEHRDEVKMRIGFLIHELRNAVGTATLAFKAIELGGLTIDGATGTILKRSLGALTALIHRGIEEIVVDEHDDRKTFSVAAFLDDAGLAARLDASLLDCELEVRAVDSTLRISANRNLLHGAVANLLQNAFKFTQPNTVVSLSATAFEGRVMIEVADHCGGLSVNAESKMFVPFKQNDERRAGLGLGLSIARQNIEKDSGTLTVRNFPGKGCVFTIALPIHIGD